MRSLREGLPALDRIEDLAHARAALQRYPAPSAEQESTRERMLAFLDAHPNDAHLRTCLPGHLTASALLIDPGRGKALLTHHKKLDRWLQLGGHCDGDANLLATGWRETVEESGLTPIAFTRDPIDLDIHSIPARPGEPEHLHLDTRFLFECEPGSSFIVSDESHELGWFSPDEAAHLDLDASLRRLFRLAFP